MSAPIFACRMRSRPSRSGVPGRHEPQGGEHRFRSRWGGHDVLPLPLGSRCSARRPRYAEATPGSPGCQPGGDQRLLRLRDRTLRDRRPTSRPARRRGRRASTVGTIARVKPEPRRLGEAARAAAAPSGPRRRGRPRRSTTVSGVTAAPSCAPGDRERDREVERRARRRARRRRRSRTRRRPVELDARVLLEHREQHREPVRRRCPAPTGAASARAVGDDERLHLDEQRARALEHRGDRPSRARRRGGRRGTAPTRRARRRGPRSVISNSPSSSVRAEPVLQRVQHAAARGARSPSNESTVSTTCSSTRGPASVPSLVTWPTSTRRRCRVLLREPHEPVRAVAHLGDRAGRAGQVGIERRSGSSRPRARRARPRRRARARAAATSPRRRAGRASSAPSRSARSRTCARDSSAVTSRHARAAPRPCARAPGAAACSCPCPARRRAA